MWSTQMWIMQIMQMWSNKCEAHRSDIHTITQITQMGVKQMWSARENVNPNNVNHTNVSAISVWL